MQVSIAVSLVQVLTVTVPFCDNNFFFKYGTSVTKFSFKTSVRILAWFITRDKKFQKLKGLGLELPGTSRVKVCPFLPTEL